MNQNFLRSALAKESRAYGFTIAFWGSGAMLISESGLPGLFEALSYGGGAVVGFGALTILAYRRTLSPVDFEESQVMILGMVHYFAALFPVILSYYLAGLPSPWSFLSAGFAASTVYNLGMLAEEALSEKARELEDVFVEKI
ncbi:MAG: hypothetical protein ABEJ95_00600 [Candidatus Nanohalobium sp.]